MSSVHQYPCTEGWEDRYEGLVSPKKCSPCAELPPHMMYSDKDYQKSTHARHEGYGGGWIFVNELGRSSEDIDAISEIQPEGYFLPVYNMKGLRWNEVLVQRTSGNWCDSWGRQSSKWVEDDGASMCVQSDDEHVYCMTNHNKTHSWRQQPTSHFAKLCGKKGDFAACECWPYEEGREKICFADHADNVPAPKHVTIHSLEEDGSVVKVSFRGEEKKETLRVGNYGAFLDGVGCSAATPVQYRVYVRCLGCTTERADFHSKDGLHLNSRMAIPQWGHDTEDLNGNRFTYEAWFKSPLVGKFRREIFGGVDSGLALVNEDKVPCDTHHQNWEDENMKTGYQVHAGNTNVYGSICFQPNMFYHVAVTKSPDGKFEGVHVYVNGHSVGRVPEEDNTDAPSDLKKYFGGGFTDGGQLFNVRIWNYARNSTDIYQDSAVTDPGLLNDMTGLVHWWPLTGDTIDVMTGKKLKGEDVRYAPIWCSDLEATGMRVC